MLLKRLINADLLLPDSDKAWREPLPARLETLLIRTKEPDQLEHNSHSSDELLEAALPARRQIKKDLDRSEEDVGSA